MLDNNLLYSNTSTIYDTPVRYNSNQIISWHCKSIYHAVDLHPCEVDRRRITHTLIVWSSSSVYPLCLIHTVTILKPALYIIYLSILATLTRKRCQLACTQQYGNAQGCTASRLLSTSVVHPCINSHDRATQFWLMRPWCPLSRFSKVFTRL